MNGSNNSHDRNRRSALDGFVQFAQISAPLALILTCNFYLCGFIDRNIFYRSFGLRVGILDTPFQEMLLRGSPAMIISLALGVIFALSRNKMKFVSDLIWRFFHIPTREHKLLNILFLFAICISSSWLFSHVRYNVLRDLMGG